MIWLLWVDMGLFQWDTKPRQQHDMRDLELVHSYGRDMELE